MARRSLAISGRTDGWPFKMSMNAPRYAIYYAPSAASALWQFGSHVLGYDAETGENIAPPDFLGDYIDRWPGMTSEPRKYGFHATLKAPFRLAVGFDEAMLIFAVRHFASITTKVLCDGLRVANVGPFLALTPNGDEGALCQLAFAIVEHFEPFRAPLSDGDRVRRLASPLTSKQIQYLDRFGYPYVNDEFRFHMTLTNSLHQDDRQTVSAILEHASAEPLSQFDGFIDRICLFKQDTPSTRFKIIASADLN